MATRIHARRRTGYRAVQLDQLDGLRLVGADSGVDDEFLHALPAAQKETLGERVRHGPVRPPISPKSWVRFAGSGTASRRTHRWAGSGRAFPPVDATAAIAGGRNQVEPAIAGEIDQCPAEPAHGQSMRGATSRPGVERPVRGGRADQRLDSVRNRAGRAQQGLLYQQLM